MAEFDLVVIGGGPAGYVPAIKATLMGKKAAIIEESEIGGTCLNHGCIPTKTLVSSAALLRHARISRRFGLTGELDKDYIAISKRKDMVVNRLRKGVQARVNALGIELITGHAVITAPDIIKVEEREISTDFVLLSPGSEPALPGPLGINGVLTSQDVLAWENLPESLMIVGGGVIGCEFASIYSTFGIQVTIIEMLPSILPGIDEDIKNVVHKALVKNRVKIVTGNGAKRIAVSGKKAVVTLADGKVLEAEKILTAVGRKPRLKDIGLEICGIKVDEKGIVVNDSMKTNLLGVYAAGDVTGKWQLAHAGSAQALTAVDSMFGSGRRRVNPDTMPGCIFTFPEIAVVGPGEEEWNSRGVQVATGYSRYIANGRAVGMNETEGFLKLVVRTSDGKIVGVQIVGTEASSLIGEACMLVNLGVRVKELAEFIHPHPTLSELFVEAAESFGDGSIHG